MQDESLDSDSPVTAVQISETIFKKYKLYIYRAPHHDNRVSIHLAVIALLLGLYIHEIKIPQILGELKISRVTFLHYILIIPCCMALLMAAICIILLCYSYIGNKYKTMNVTSDMIEDVLCHSVNIVNEFINATNKETIEENNRMIVSKKRLYDEGVLAYRMFILLGCFSLVVNTFF